MSSLEELFQIANQLSKYDNRDLTALDALEKTAKTVGKSWSGSWLGYHSRVYYANFQPPPSGAVFSQEWGFLEGCMFSPGDWVEYDPEDVVNFTNNESGNLSIDECIAESTAAKEVFEEAQQSALSLIHANIAHKSDEFIAKLVKDIASTKIFTESDFIQHQRPSGQLISRDSRAIEKGLIPPPHIVVLSRINAARSPFLSCADLKKHIRRFVNHIQRLENETNQENRVPTKVFIGHGHSLAWRELKDFISDRLKLPWDEFSRLPVAGVPNTIRLAQMLDQACMAFLLMTAEDEDAEGNLHARENVIHEAGLFQGRLSFERAIILLEEGCQEFSNIEGLGQIRFPKGNISAVFEEIRRVLEREKIIQQK